MPVHLEFSQMIQQSLGIMTTLFFAKPIIGSYASATIFTNSMTSHTYVRMYMYIYAYINTFNLQNVMYFL